VGEALAASPVYRLVSATGSTAMGRRVAAVVGARLGRSLLELGGNNAMIVAPSARQELALRAALFSAVGTAGQRCTTLRRLLVQETIAEGFIARLTAAYQSLRVGDPREPSTLVGPLIDEAACAAMELALAEAVAQGGRLLAGGERVRAGSLGGGFYMQPALVEIAADAVVVQRETFAPILYLHRYSRFEEALALQNGVSQGLSSALFSESLSETEHFLAQSGSDCGISNVNLGTSGAEIGGAFGGEKDTGGGRESGSDAWKGYMRRTTNTVNYGTTLPLAQGVRFEME
jgi:aldehyde dehydrogenase (NAD+)